MKEKQNYVTFKYIYVDIAKDVETRFDWINERWIRWKMVTDFATLIPKTQSYLTDDINENEKAKDTKTCIIKQKIKL